MNRSDESSSAGPANPILSGMVPAALCVLVVVGPARAQWRGLRVVGGEESLWVLYEALRPEGPETRVWMRQSDRGFHRPRNGARQPPHVHAAAVDGRYLHLFWETGSHYRLGPRRVSPQRMLPGRVAPLCLAGDTPDQALFAIAEELGTPSSVPATTRAASRPGPTGGLPAGAGDRSDGAAATGQPRRWSLYRYHGKQWTVVSILPGWFDADEDHWMCADQGQVDLFGVVPVPGSPVWWRRWSLAGWAPAEEVPVPPRAKPVAAMVVDTYLVLVVRVPVTGGGSKVVALRRAAQEWEQAELRTERDRPVDLAPDRLGAAGFNERIALVGQFDKGQAQPQVGLWSVSGGLPEEPPGPLPEWAEKTASPLLPNPPELVIYAVVVAVVGLTFWRRRHSLTQDIPLPAQVALASIWRRSAAFFIDIAPVIAIAAVYWLPALDQMNRQIGFEDLTEAEQAEQRFAVLLGPWLVIRAVYALYCGLTEYRWGGTPGKRLMQCWVMSDDLMQPRLKQIVIRNALKILELQPEVIALLAVMALTRNRQRLGDLLAGTIVVEPAAPPPEE